MVHHTGQRISIMINKLKGHKLMNKYMKNASLLNILSNLESNEYFLLEQNILLHNKKLRELQIDCRKLLSFHKKF